MNEQLNKKQRIKYFGMNLIAFASIFLILGLIVFRLLQLSIYESVDQDLEHLVNNTNFVERQLGMQDEAFTPPFGDGQDKPPNNNFQQQVVLWSSAGEIVNGTQLGSRLYDFENLTLDTHNLNKIITIQTKDSNDRTLQFRAITIPVTTDNDIAYLQILVNIDPITGTIQQVKNILIICMIIFWLLSIALSYFLSKSMMKPILLSWQKQQEFVENASHELRTPLTIIQAQLERLFTQPTHTILEESETIALSLDEVKRMTQLTSDLLLLARSDANAIVLEKEPTNLQAFLTPIFSTFAEVATTQAKNFTVDLGSDARVWLDRKKIHQLLLILLDNALKYTQAGDKITVKSTIKNNEWHLQIIDTGIGIEDTHKKAIFDRFYRGERSRNRKTGGYGIGLAIAKWIVTEHRGRIRVMDTEPKGTTFLIILPIK